MAPLLERLNIEQALEAAFAAGHEYGVESQRWKIQTLERELKAAQCNQQTARQEAQIKLMNAVGQILNGLGMVYDNGPR